MKCVPGSGLYLPLIWLNVFENSDTLIAKSSGCFQLTRVESDKFSISGL